MSEGYKWRRCCRTRRRNYHYTAHPGHLGWTNPRKGETADQLQNTGHRKGAGRGSLHGHKCGHTLNPVQRYPHGDAPVQRSAITMFACPRPTNPGAKPTNWTGAATSPMIAVAVPENVAGGEPGEGSPSETDGFVAPNSRDIDHHHRSARDGICGRIRRAIWILGPRLKPPPASKMPSEKGATTQSGDCSGDRVVDDARSDPCPAAVSYGT